MRDRRLSWVAWFVTGVFVFALAMTMVSCGTLSGLGRDITAASDGIARSAVKQQEVKE